MLVRSRDPSATCWKSPPTPTQESVPVDVGGIVGCKRELQRLSPTTTPFRGPFTPRCCGNACFTPTHINMSYVHWCDAMPSGRASGHVLQRITMPSNVLSCVVVCCCVTRNSTCHFYCIFVHSNK